MIELHPESLEKNGQPGFAVLPYGEFRVVREILLDYEDLRDLHAAKVEEANAPTLSLREVAKRYKTKNSDREQTSA